MRCAASISSSHLTTSACSQYQLSEVRSEQGQGQEQEQGQGQIWVARAGGRSDEKDPNQPVWIHKIPLRDVSIFDVNSGTPTGSGSKEASEAEGADEADQEYLMQAAALLGE